MIGLSAASARESTSGASVSGASVSGASVSGASVSGASVSGASVSGASVSGASVSGASVSGASVSGASVSGASVSGALVSGVGAGVGVHPAMRGSSTSIERIIARSFFISVTYYQMIILFLGAMYILSVRFTLNVVYHSSKFLGVMFARRIAGP
ncbi:MAG: pentapeptide repeat-containing protein [Ruminococcaceae bacterium]|nr:pentapeptide repeat-containing protein [Oscillospiraceae bacterium]